MRGFSLVLLVAAIAFAAARRVFPDYDLDRYSTAAIWTGAAGVLGFVLSMLSVLFSTRLRRGASSIARSIPEIAPREEYVDEWDFNRKIEGGFRTRGEAAAWLLQDPFRKCDYCGGELKSLTADDREAVQLVTFYKKVPEGARDLRIVLGSFWFTKSATDLKCSSCQRVLRR